MTSSYYTQTPNFVSAAQGGVDPRTGLFSVSMPITNLVGNNNLGPALQLSLSYMPLSGSDPFSLGVGCTLGLSCYDRLNQSLTLSTGEQYLTFDYDTYVIVSEMKQVSFQFVKIENSDYIEYHVIYKSGQVEILRSFDNNCTFFPVNIFTPAGHGLTLTWQHLNGQPIQLLKINDDENVLCKFTYENIITIDIFQSTLEAYRILLEYNISDHVGKYLTSLTNQAGTWNLTWNFGYDTVKSHQGESYRLLTQVTAPTGYIQRVSYNNWLSFPKNAQLPDLPAVSEYWQYPQFDQPNLYTTYNFSNNNYIGGSAGGLTDWNPSRDNLYSVDSNYTYGSRETQRDGTYPFQALSYTERTYNNYHLLQTELTVQGNCSRKTDIEYYAVLGYTFDQQADQYQQPYQQVVTYTDTSQPKGKQTRQEYTSTTFDDYGNQLVNAVSSFPVLTLTHALGADGKLQLTPQWIATPDGTVTTYVYYDPNGEQGCPPDPNGFARFIKTQTVTPAPTQYKDAPTTIASYTYQAMSGPYIGNQQKVITSVVVAESESHTSNGQLLSSKTTTYVDEPNSPEHGRVKHVEGTIYGLDDGKAYTSTIDLTFDVQVATQTEPTALVQTATFKGFDGCTVQIGKSQSCLSGRTLSVTDRYHNVTSYTYDLLGRILTKTLNSTSDTYRSTTQTSYTLTQDPNSGQVTEISTTVTDEHGNAVRTCHDGMGRTIEQWTNDIDAGATDTATYKTQTQTYDNLGRALVSTEFDYLRKEPGVKADTTAGATSATTLSYNDWGQNHLTTLDTESEAHSDYDPIQLLHSSYACSYTKQGTIPPSTVLSKQQVQQDIAKFTSITTHYDHNGVAHGSQVGAYDGLKRLRRMTDELGRVTTYIYDAFGRVTTTTLPDNSVVTKTYAPHSKSALITGITLWDGVLKKTYDLGCQEFDSLHRLKSTTSGGIVSTVGGKSTRTGGRTYTYNYNAADGTPTCNAQPRTVTTPNNEVITYSYIPELSNAVHTVDVGDISQTLEYYSNADTVSADAIPGAPPQMPKATGALKSATEAGGMVLGMDYYKSGQLSTEMFTPKGASAKKSTAYTYSLLGRAQFYTDVGQVQQQYSYNPDGSTDSIIDPKMTVKLAYDSIGRFQSQTVTDLTSNHCLKTQLTLNDFNQEIGRDFYENGSSTPTMSIAQSYYDNGQRYTRTTTKHGDATPLRAETYYYDERNRLQTYTCSGTALPVDAYGKPIQSQAFTYDGLSNILTCTTTFPDGQDIATFHYDNANDATQLTSVTHSNPAAGYPAKIDLSKAYDANGRMITDEAGRTLTYDGLGRMQSITDAGGTARGYLYDALDTVVGQVVSDTDTRELYYRSNILVNEISSSTNQNTRFIKMGNSCVGQVTE